MCYEYVERSKPLPDTSDGDLSAVRTKDGHAKMGISMADNNLVLFACLCWQTTKDNNQCLDYLRLEVKSLSFIPSKGLLLLSPLSVFPIHLIPHSLFY